MGILEDDKPDILDFHIHLDERHPPDPIGWSDWVLVGLAAVTVICMLFGNLFLFILRNTSPGARAKNIPIVFSMSYASIIHIAAVLLNEIFLIPQRATVVTYILNSPDTSKDDVYSTDASTISLIDSASAGFFSSNFACVFLYFWIEYFMGLSFFLSMIALRLIILLNVASRDMRLAMIHLRKKFAIRTLYISMFMLPMFTLALFISTRGIAHMTLYTDEPDSYFPHTKEAFDWIESKSTRREEDAEDNIKWVTVRTSCETPMGFKMTLILILGFYVCILLILSRKLVRTNLDFDYTSSTLDIVYLAIPVLCICAIVHFLHALTYHWGRFIFVSLIIILHLFSYLRIVLPDMGGPMRKLFCGGTESDMAKGMSPYSPSHRHGGSYGEMRNLSSITLFSTDSRSFIDGSQKSSMAHLTSDLLISSPILSDQFYRFCILAGTNLSCCFRAGTFIHGSSSEDHLFRELGTTMSSNCKNIRNAGIPRTTDVENIVQCITELSTLVTVIESLPSIDREERRDTLVSRDNRENGDGIVSSTPDLLLVDCDIIFTSFDTHRLKPISRLGTEIKTVFFTPSNELPPLINMQHNGVPDFKASWNMTSINLWNSGSVYKIREVLQAFLINEFGDAFVFSRSNLDTKKEVSDTVKTMRNLLAEGMVTKECLREILGSLETDGNYQAVFGNTGASKYDDIVYEDDGSDEENGSMKRIRGVPPGRSPMYGRGSSEMFTRMGEPNPHGYSPKQTQESGMGGLGDVDDCDDDDYGLGATNYTQNKKNIFSETDNSDQDDEGLDRGGGYLPEFDSQFSKNPLWLLLEGYGIDEDSLPGGDNYDDDEEDLQSSTTIHKNVYAQEITRTLLGDISIQGGRVKTRLKPCKKREVSEQLLGIVSDSEYDFESETDLPPRRPDGFAKNLSSLVNETLPINGDFTLGGESYNKSIEAEVDEMMKHSTYDIPDDELRQLFTDLVYAKRKDNDRKGGYIDLGKGMILYPSPISALVHFIYHIWLWTSMPLHQWHTCNAFYSCIHFFSIGRKLLSSPCACGCCWKIREAKQGKEEGPTDGLFMEDIEMRHMYEDDGGGEDDTLSVNLETDLGFSNLL
jgi:hypothetical protein